jgi:hypothetical protein
MFWIHGRQYQNWYFDIGAAVDTTKVSEDRFVGDAGCH